MLGPAVGLGPILGPAVGLGPMLGPAVGLGPMLRPAVGLGPMLGPAVGLGPMLLGVLRPPSSRETTSTQRHCLPFGGRFGAVVLCIKPTSSPPILQISILNYEIDLK